MRSGEKIKCLSLILTAGTFLSGVIHIGERKILAGRMGEQRSEGITDSLVSFGFSSGRLKTGTPPRLDKSSINWKKTSVSLGDIRPTPFSYSTKSLTHPTNLAILFFQIKKHMRLLKTTFTFRQCFQEILVERAPLLPIV